MANKRELKKFIRNSCGAVAVDMVLAREAFPQIKSNDVHTVVRDAVALQENTIGKVNISFDRCPSDFENAADYAKARRAYFRHAYHKLLVEFDEGIQAIVKTMNAALPQEVRQKIKEALTE